MSGAAPGDVTWLVQQASAGSSAAAEELFAQVYSHLRKIAQQRMNQERPGHTLQATALVHEAYLRLLGGQNVPWRGRAEFFAAAAEAMRRILVEHARARGRVKRGGGAESPRRRVPLNVVNLAVEDDPQEILSVDEAVCRLERQDADLARIVRLRFYAGLSEKETAELLGVTDRTVRRAWALARAWLRRELDDLDVG